MFDRSAKNNVQRQSQPPIPAELTCDDGRVLKGKFHISGNRTIYEILNGSGLFLDFEQHTGERELIAKTSIRAIKLITLPAANKLTTTQDQATFDPHKILGLQRGVTSQKVHEAYLSLSKIYHPDRYAGSGLPNEVLEYLNNQTSRINTAFAALKQPEQTNPSTQRPASLQAKPVYTSSRQF